MTPSTAAFWARPARIAQIEAFYRQFRRADTLVLVDPVMGDHGKPYRTYTPELCRRMEELAAQADVITPNLTEASLLLGEDYASCPGDEGRPAGLAGAAEPWTGSAPWCSRG